ncbi:MAG: REP-associated tyrosine transposase [Gaiellales bacterium]|jgi:REP element-mobilizing transposase RayT|nr:REP-associated tyrosine transposase [Gaiellales bacterium]
MPRRPRITFDGAIHHVYTTGVRHSHIYLTPDDRSAFSCTLAEVCRRSGWQIYSDCQMGTHYHLLLLTPRANLPYGMQFLNSAYAVRFNRLHEVEGHLFKGRYGSRLVTTDSYALELIRYIALNPVRSGLVDRPEDWRWGSYRALVGLDPAESYLSTSWVLEQFHESPAHARRSLTEFVRMGLDMDDLSRPSLGRLLSDDSPASIRRARDVCGYTLQAIADHLGISVTTVWRRSQRR